MLDYTISPGSRPWDNVVYFVIKEYIHQLIILLYVNLRIEYFRINF